MEHLKETQKYKYLFVCTAVVIIAVTVYILSIIGRNSQSLISNFKEIKILSDDHIILLSNYNSTDFTNFNSKLHRIRNAQEEEWFVAQENRAENLNCFVFAVDESGAIYLTGDFSGSVQLRNGFNLNADETNRIDCFLIKYNNDNEIEFIKTWGGPGDDYALGITVDKDNNVIICGVLQNEVEIGSESVHINFSSKGGKDAFILKLDSFGEPLWFKSWGGIENDGATEIALDPSGNIFVAGGFKDQCQFNPARPDLGYSAVGEDDCFLSKFDTDGNYLWTTVWGSDYRDTPEGLCTDDQGNVYVTGWLSGISFLNNEMFRPLLQNYGCEDIFLIKFTCDGNFSFGETWGSIWNDGCMDVIVSENNEIYLTGYYQSDIRFQIDHADLEFSANGSADGILMKTDDAGKVIWVRSWGIERKESFGTSLAFDGEGNLHVVGSIGYENFHKTYNDLGDIIN